MALTGRAHCQRQVAFFTYCHSKRTKGQLKVVIRVKCQILGHPTVCVSVQYSSALIGILLGPINEQAVIQVTSQSDLSAASARKKH